MTQVSKYYLRKNVLNHIFDMFLSLIVKIKTKKSAHRFYEEFFSPTERVMFAKRLAIGILIAKKYEYREISTSLKVSTATINRFSVLYKQGTSYKKFVDTILLSQELQMFLLELGEGLANIADIGGAKTTGWRGLKQDIAQKKRNLEL